MYYIMHITKSVCSEVMWLRINCAQGGRIKIVYLRILSIEKADFV